METTRRIRTSPPTARRDRHDGGQQTRLLLRIGREVLSSARIESYADLKPAILDRLRRLRVRYHVSELHDAISVLGASGALRFLTTPAAVHASATKPASQPLSQTEASDLYERLLRRCRVGGLKTISSTTGRIRLDDTRVDDVVDLESLVAGAR